MVFLLANEHAVIAASAKTQQGDRESNVTLKTVQLAVPVSLLLSPNRAARPSAYSVDSERQACRQL